MFKVNIDRLKSIDTATSGGKFFYKKKRVTWYCFAYEPRRIGALLSYSSGFGGLPTRGS